MGGSYRLVGRSTRGRIPVALDASSASLGQPACRGPNSVGGRSVTEAIVARLAVLRNPSHNAYLVGYYITKPKSLPLFSTPTMTTTQPTKYKVTEAAAILGVPPNTVRNWTTQYAGLLSGSERAHGDVRLLTEDDLAILAMVRDSRAAGKSAKVIAHELSQLPAASLPRAGGIVDAQEGLGRTESSLAVLGEVETRLGALPAAIVAELGPLLDAAWERGRSQGLAEGRRKVPPEYVLIAVTLGLLFAAVAALALNR